MNLKSGMVGLCFLFSSLLLCVPSSWAITLSFNPAASSVGVGDPLSIDVVISDMQNADLGAFDFNVNYDDTLLAFDSYSLGSGLGDIDLFEADDWSLGDLGGGVIHLSELSWLWDLSFQPDAFTLATLSFTGTGAGTSSLSFSGVTLSDDWAYPLQANLVPGAIEATAPVPEPATLLLFGTGLVGLVGARKRFRK